MQIELAVVKTHSGKKDDFIENFEYQCVQKWNTEGFIITRIMT
jgi:hypothetical protein